MPKIEAGVTTGSFLINGRPYVVGEYVQTDDALQDGTSTTAVIGISSKYSLPIDTIGSGDLSTWTDINDATFADMQAFWDYIDTFFYSSTTGSKSNHNINLTVVNTSVYTILASDVLLNVTYPSTGTCVITWPTALMELGRKVIIKDASLNAGTNNITIIGGSGETIDGDSEWLINGDGDWLDLYSDGSNLLIIG
jgi:hypothetical protein